MRNMYTVGGIDPTDEKECAKMCYAFLHLDCLYEAEATILNKEGGKSYLPGLVFPTDACAITFRSSEIPSWEEFYKIYCENRMGILCVASFDEADTDRVTLVVAPPDEMLPEDMRMIVSLNNEGDNVDKFFDGLYLEYDKVGE